MTDDKQLPMMWHMQKTFLHGRREPIGIPILPRFQAPPLPSYRTACVRMQSREEAQEVIDALHGSEMGGNRVVVEFALNKSKNRVRIPRRPFEDVAWTGRQRLEAFTRGPYTYNPYEPPPHFVEQAYPKRLLTPRRSPSQSPYGAPARRTAFNYGSATY